MSAELGDWLTELRETEPACAVEVGAALVAVDNAADPAALSVVRPVAAEPADPREGVDRAYQDMLEALQHMRRDVAEVASVRKRCAAAEAEAGEQASDVRARLQLQLSEVERRERELAERSQRLQSEVDSFRTAKEVGKATYTAAEATLRIYQKPGFAPDDAEAARDEQIAGAQARLDAAADALRELANSLNAAAVADLLELRADALDRDVRLLMAVEPADTMTLLAVLDGAAVVAEHYQQAVRLASELLADIRAGEWPPADALGPADVEMTFADAASFLARFFPADSDTIVGRAADLAMAQTMAVMRAERGISIEDLAVETGISEDRLRAIEHGGLRVARVHEAAAYVRALGGRLMVAAQIDESAPVELT